MPAGYRITTIATGAGVMRRVVARNEGPLVIGCTLARAPGSRRARGVLSIRSASRTALCVQETRDHVHD